MSDPSTSANTAEAVAPSLKKARELGERLEALPQVASVTSLASFLPANQDQKIPIIKSAAQKLKGAFDMREAPQSAPDAENVDALNEGASRLAEAAGKQTGPGAEAARRLAGLMTALARAPRSLRDKASQTLISPLNVDLADLQASLEARPVTPQTLPRGLVADWMTEDGQARVSVAPKASANDIPAMRAFVAAVLAVAPDATEGPIATLSAGDMILSAFIEAGVPGADLDCASVVARAAPATRRAADACSAGARRRRDDGDHGADRHAVQLRQHHRFAAAARRRRRLQDLLHHGLAREGTTHLLQTPLTRAVIFSALTTATAFGSLWLSSHPGASSMGKLLALSLLCTLAAAVVFQPILMGKPRKAAQSQEFNR